MGEFINQNPQKETEFCPICRLYKENCFCGILKKFDLKTKITLIIHHKEVNRITNTGRLANLCLTNSSFIIKGDEKKVIERETLLPGDYCNFRLTPNGSAELNADFIKRMDKPVNLIIPDGTWRQARRIIRSEPLLHTVHSVRLPPDKPSSFFLRKEREVSHVCTFEAIARALGILEGEEIRTELEIIFNTMIERLLSRYKRKKIIDVI